MKTAAIFILFSFITVTLHIFLNQNNPNIIFAWDKSDAKIKSDNRDLLLRLSKTVDSIQIIDCKLSPPVLRAYSGKKIKVKNQDEEENIIATDIRHSFVIPQNSQAEIVLELGHGNGIYGVSCNGSKKLAGIIILD